MFSNLLILRSRADGKLLKILLLLALATPVPAAQNYLFYLEAQGIGGWSFGSREVIFFSMDPMEAMQKPSLGFDYVQRFSGSRGDFAVLALQARLVYNQEGEKRFEPQLYNAYLKVKSNIADFWIGHNKPKFGLSTALDNHGTLLQPLSMMGFGFDRDWGIGLDKDFAGGSAGLSLTAGSGMALKLKGNFLAAAHIVSGVLEQDNHSLGFSAAVGQVLEAKGLNLLADTPQNFLMAGFDGSWLVNSWQHNLDIMAGMRDNRAALAVSWRTGLGLLAEARLKLEVQPAFLLFRGKGLLQLAAGASFLATADMTVRTMIAYDGEMKDTKLVFQIYYYKGVRF
jgi:hypothetical protein